MSHSGHYVPVGSVPYTLSPGTAEDLGEVRKLVHETTSWLRKSKHIDQWSGPWPDAAQHRERMRSDLLRGKTWLVRDDATVVGTITVDTEEPRTADGRRVWPACERHELAMYVRRVIVSRGYAHRGIGAALLDWAAAAAGRDHGATRIRIDVWTTNRALHAYFEHRGFTRCPSPDPDLNNYPSQALFERQIEQAGEGYAKLFVQADSPGPHPPHWRRIDRVHRRGAHRIPGRGAGREVSELATAGPVRSCGNRGS